MSDNNVTLESLKKQIASGVLQLTVISYTMTARDKEEFE